MKAIIVTQKGNAGVLQLQGIPTPQPGPDEVRIKVFAAGVNHTDLVVREGGYGYDPKGHIPGVEVAGIIEECGSDVIRWEKGDKVCALIMEGGYAEYVVVEGRMCLPVPKDLTCVEAASLVETSLTVWSNVFMQMHLKEDEKFLVHGGSSGIGVAAIQIAKAHGAAVFATAGTDEKCAFCEELGADKCVNYKTADFEVAFKDMGIDVILDYIGGDYTKKNIDLLNIGGRMCNIAALKGSKVNIDLIDVMKKNIIITGSMLKAQTDDYKARLIADVEEKVWPLITHGKLKPVVYKLFNLSQAAEAHKLMESSEHMGKIMLQVADENQ
jgi:NADPH:quinone reductase